MARKPIIVGNWKMNQTQKEAKDFIVEVEKHLTGQEGATYGIGAPYTALNVLRENAKHLIVAAENCHFEDSGAFTGEVSVPMLKEIGIDYCIIGHSERRTYYNETNEACAKKAKRLLQDDIIPILCVGETLEQYEKGETNDVVTKQLHGSLEGLTGEEVSKMVIAYEPIWAIGTGKSADQTIAQACCKLVRDVIIEMYDETVGQSVRIQYGGSVKPENIKSYMECEDIDGALIGGASLKVPSWLEIIEATK